MQPAEMWGELKHFSNQEYDPWAVVLVQSTHHLSTCHGFIEISCHRRDGLQESNTLPRDNGLLKDNLNER